ncbi:MAG TPA: CDP-alcohol phosphatidyltransferase family protein [Phycicoccus sp.]|nr:CDP-alcohol phosphatidyltransferase family protein [Phycicoccus sp.]
MPPPTPPTRGPGVVRSGVVGLAGLTVVLGALAATTGLGAAGWLAGLGCGVLFTTLVAGALTRAGRRRPGPADTVTLGRGLLACALAALTTDSLPGSPGAAALLVLAVPALAMDAVDGAVARRTGTASSVGARLDGEVDAFLILVLGVAAGPVVGWWAVTAGLARYAFGAAGWVLPWLRRPLPHRYWRKVVTAVVGIALTSAAADVLPRPVSTGAVLLALLLLGESFGRDVWWTWRRRADAEPVRPRWRRVAPGLRAVGVCIAVALVWFAVLAPAQPERIDAAAFARLPVEPLALLAVLVVLPSRARRVVALVAGVLLGALALAKVLDLGMTATLGRPFDVVTDTGSLGAGLSFVRDALGEWAAVGVVVAALALLGVLAVGLPRAVVRGADVAARHQRLTLRTLAALAGAWAVLAASGVGVAPGTPLAAAEVGPYVADRLQAARVALHDRAAFEAALRADPFSDPASADLSALRGKDVLVVFVESYGRAALEGSGSAAVRQLLDDSTARLAADGFGARSAFLTSPTFGGSSWLAHATLESGLQVADQGSYDRLLTSDRTTLVSAFARRGWRTVAVLPSTRGSWPEGRAFYRFGAVLGRSDLGYAGPAFGFSGMPDQFALAALDRLELDRPHTTPVMAEVELTSSHGPWAPLPTTVAPAELGDGSVFRGIEARARTATDLWSHREDVPAAYRTSIAYSLRSVVDLVARHRGNHLVLLVLGDHQPSTIVSGFSGNRDVPVTLIADDPALLRQAAAWGWQPGLRPDAAAPVQPMAALRDRFLTAFSDPAAR